MRVLEACAAAVYVASMVSMAVWAVRFWRTPPPPPETPFERAMRELGEAFDGVVRQIGERLRPAFEAMAKWLE